MMDYGGGRTEDTIVSWINKKTGPASKEVADCAAMEAETAEGKLNLSYFGDLSGDLWDAYMGAAKSAAIGEKFSFFHTSDASCGEKFGLSGAGLALTRKFDESPLAYDGAASLDDIVTFAKLASTPTLIPFSQDYIEPIFTDKNPAVILFTEETGTSYQEGFANAAKELKGDVLFVTSGVSDGMEKKLADFVGVTKADTPCIRLLDPRGDGMLKFHWDGDISHLCVGCMRDFLGQFREGKLEPHLKSEPVPEEQGALTVLVGKNWEQVVKDETKDVLVKYYAPWCGHCKKLAPIWDELAEEVKDIEDLVIAKFDATANEVAGI